MHLHAQRFHRGAVVGEDAAAFEHLLQGTAEEVKVEHLGRLHGEEAAAVGRGRDHISIGDLDGILHRDGRRRGAGAKGCLHRLGDDRLGHQRTGAVVDGGVGGLRGSQVQTCHHRSRPRLAAQGDPTDLGEAIAQHHGAHRLPPILPHHENDIVDEGILLEAPDGMRQHRLAGDVGEDFIRALHTAGGTGRHQDGGTIIFPFFLGKTGDVKLNFHPASSLLSCCTSALNVFPRTMKFLK